MEPVPLCLWPLLPSLVSCSRAFRPSGVSHGSRGWVWLVLSQPVSRCSYLADESICANLVDLVLVLTVAVGVQDRPSAAPQTGPWSSDYRITATPTPASAFQALSTLVFAYAGTPAFFSIVSEMREPRKYVRSMAICQGVVTALYLAIGIVVYYFCGSYVASPALGSAGVLMKRICYGLALPGLLASMILLSHVSKVVAAALPPLTTIRSLLSSSSSAY